MSGFVGKFAPPLVSIVITNYNYGRFVGEAVDSVVAQTYPDIECVVVDDASTDDSGALLEALASRAPSVRVIRHPTNLGQGGAFCTGLEATVGEYVVFLDADDVLLPQFVETHVYVHLSSRIPVGFTSSDVLQADGARIVTSCCRLLNGYVTSGRGRSGGLLRGIEKSAPDLWRLENAQRLDLGSKAHLVEVGHEWSEWIFAPTSGNCFRRDALQMFQRHDKLSQVRFNADTYLNKGVCLLSGAIIIDQPLTVYRVHNANGFANHPELLGVRASDAVKEARADHCAWRTVVDLLIEDAGYFVEKLGIESYVRAVARLDTAGVTLPVLPEQEPPAFYIEAKIEACAQALHSSLCAADIQYLRDRLEDARRKPVLRRRNPRRGVKPFAEFFLTLGRALDAPRISALGERLWGS